MNAKEKKQLEEQREKMIKDAKWSIEYHTKKLEEAKITLQLLINNNQSL
jgi:hypothetical protein